MMAPARSPGSWFAVVLVALIGLVAAACSDGEPGAENGVDETEAAATPDTSTAPPTNDLTDLVPGSTTTTQPPRTGFFAPLDQPVGVRPAFADYANAGPLADPGFYPIAVWWQYPWQAQAYLEMGVNVYIWPDSEANMCGPDDRQRCLEGIVESGMVLIPKRDDHTTSPSVESGVVAWFTCDEPDIMEWSRKNCGEPGAVYDDVIVELAGDDPTRPVYTNFSDGLARPELDTPEERFDLNWLDGLWDRSKPADDPDPGPPETGEDFREVLLPAWCEANGLLSTDAYWFSSDSRRGPIWFYGRNVTIGKERCGRDRPIMNAVETAAQGTAGTGTPANPEPADVMAMVYSSVAAGADGIIYFPQQTDNGGSVRTGSTFLSDPGSFDVPAEVTDTAMYDTLKGVNLTLQFLAPVLNSGWIEPSLVDPGVAPGTVDLLVKRYGGEVFLVAISRAEATPVRFDLAALGVDSAEVFAVTGTGLDERELTLSGGRLLDELEAETPTIYRIVPG